GPAGSTGLGEKHRDPGAGDQHAANRDAGAADAGAQHCQLGPGAPGSRRRRLARRATSRSRAATAEAGRSAPACHPVKRYLSRLWVALGIVLLGVLTALWMSPSGSIWLVRLEHWNRVLDG